MINNVKEVLSQIEMIGEEIIERVGKLERNLPTDEDDLQELYENLEDWRDRLKEV